MEWPVMGHRWGHIQIVLFICAIILTFGAGIASPVNLEKPRDKRITVPEKVFDRDNDKISDYLMDKAGKIKPVRSFGKIDSGITLIVSLDHAPVKADISEVEKLGLKVKKSWSKLVYALLVAVPDSSNLSTTLSSLAKIPGVVYVEESQTLHPAMYYASKQVGARRVWSNNGVEGDPSKTIAIVDSGVDPSHPDLQDKMVVWKDFAGVSADVAGDEYDTPVDKIGHGTFVTGVAVGSGAIAGISGNIPISIAGMFSQKAGKGNRFFFPVDTSQSSGSITADFNWTNTSYDTALDLSIRDQSDNILTSTEVPSNSTQPLNISAAVDKGVQSFNYNLFASASIGNYGIYGLQVNTPMGPAGDGKNLLSGIAPGCKFAALRVLDDSGYSSNAVLLNALEWIYENKSTYNIVAANFSLEMQNPQVVEAVDTAINNLVASGVVCVGAAGNKRSEVDYEGGIGSPASASSCIAVGSTNELDQVTSYSNYGSSAVNQLKPDILAPGGSKVTHREIVSIDSNLSDTVLSSGTSTGEYFTNDYTEADGTSISSPVVAGAAALLASAMPDWSSSQDSALRIKSILEMTATETNISAEAGPNPTLDRGSRDLSEGFGRINIDAAVQSVTHTYIIGDIDKETFGANSSGKKCWAEKVELEGGKTYIFRLNVPLGADYDLYLYSNQYTTTLSTSNLSSGDPIILENSVTDSTGGYELICYNALDSGDYYIVVKWISGSGEFTLTSNLMNTPPQKPDIPSVSVSSNFVNTTCTISASWTVPVSPENITRYLFAIGSTPGGNDVYDWQDLGTATSITVEGLSLDNENSYFVSVMAEGCGGTWSDTGISSPITADLVSPTSTVTSPSTAFTSNVTVTYSASDNIALKRVTLLVDEGSGWYLYGVDDSPNGKNSYTGNFTFVATHDGLYSFVTVAEDMAGNVESVSPGDTKTLILDDFESGLSNWTVSEGVAISGDDYSSPSNSLKIGNTSQEPELYGSFTAYRTVQLPVYISTATVNFQLKAGFEDTTPFYSWERVEVRDQSGQLLEVLRNINAPNDWTAYAFDISKYAGQTIRIQFTAHMDDQGSNCWMFVDDFEVDVVDYQKDDATSVEILQQTTYSTTDHHVRPGWNLISLPGIPINSDPAVVLSGISLNNASLQLWDNSSLTGGGYSAYGVNWFGPMKIGEAYWFIESSGKDISYQGYIYPHDQKIVIPAHPNPPYWVMVGHPRNQPVDCANILFSTPSQPTPVSWQTAVQQNGWLEAAAQGFDASHQSYFNAAPAGIGISQSNQLEPWFGYWMLIKTSEELTITVPWSP